MCSPRLLAFGRTRLRSRSLRTLLVRIKEKTFGVEVSTDFSPQRGPAPSRLSRREKHTAPSSRT